MVTFDPPAGLRCVRGAWQVAAVGAPGSRWFLQPQERGRAAAAEMLRRGDHDSFSLFCSYEKNAPPKSAKKNKKNPNWSWPPASLHTSDDFQPRPVRRATSCFHSDRLRSVFFALLFLFHLVQLLHERDLPRCSPGRPHGPTPSLPPGRCLVALTAPGLRARRHFWLLCWWYAALRPLGEILVRGRAAPDPLSAKISWFVEAGGGGGRVGCHAGRSGSRRSIATQLRSFRH